MEIDAEVIKSLIDMNTRPSEAFTQTVEKDISEFVETQNKKPTVDEMRLIYASAFSELAGF